MQRIGKITYETTENCGTGHVPIKAILNRNWAMVTSKTKLTTRSGSEDDLVTKLPQRINGACVTAAIKELLHPPEDAEEEPILRQIEEALDPKMDTLDNLMEIEQAIVRVFKTLMSRKQRQKGWRRQFEKELCVKRMRQRRRYSNDTKRIGRTHFYKRKDSRHATNARRR